MICVIKLESEKRLTLALNYYWIMVSNAIFLFVHLLKNNIFGCRISWRLCYVTATGVALLKL